MKGTRTRTARTMDEVREWIESEPHHRLYSEPEGPSADITHVNLCGYGTRLRVPVDLWRKCPTRPGEMFDKRMFRWASSRTDSQRFENYEDWVRHASSWLTDHPEYCNTEHGDTKGWRGHHFTAICFDTLGRICRQGSDFMRARDEGTFPVRWVWPDQVAELFFARELMQQVIRDDD